MSVRDKNPVSYLFGAKAQTGVNRGIAEFHARRPVLVNSGGENLLALPVEGLDQQRLAEFIALCVPVMPQLIVTARRANALGLDAKRPMALYLPADIGLSAILALVTDVSTNRTTGAKPASPAAAAAIELVKLSQGLPAVLVAQAASTIASDLNLVTVVADAVAHFGEEAIRSLTIASQASVPLDSGRRARFVVFRDMMGASPVAIIVGKPDFAKPVPVRLHSACLTGDVFGSRRCDCGDQLNMAIERLEEIGGGVVLYLAQEGRGLGLANKMRTYLMQDDGLDTVDANTTLGFDDDERDYGVAARMLQLLECHQVVLMTNNPHKLDGLAKSGVEIIGRMPIEAPINADNHRYMTAKAARAGHQLNHLVASLAETPGAERDKALLVP
ncbi:MAG: GTP cyclohydrolase II [Pseudolabrys sp.]